MTTNNMPRHVSKTVLITAVLLMVTAIGAAEVSVDSNITSTHGDINMQVNYTDQLDNFTNLWMYGDNLYMDGVNFSAEDVTTGQQTTVVLNQFDASASTGEPLIKTDIHATTSDEVTVILDSVPSSYYNFKKDGAQALNANGTDGSNSYTYTQTSSSHSINVFRAGTPTTGSGNQGVENTNGFRITDNEISYNTSSIDPTDIPAEADQNQKFLFTTSGDLCDYFTLSDDEQEVGEGRLEYPIQYSFDIPEDALTDEAQTFECTVYASSDGYSDTFTVETTASLDDTETGITGQVGTGVGTVGESIRGFFRFIGDLIVAPFRFLGGLF